MAGWSSSGKVDSVIQPRAITSGCEMEMGAPMEIDTSPGKITRCTSGKS